MQKSPAVPLVLVALCLACVQAQTPRFSFATTNYNPPADEAAVAQSPSYGEGRSLCLNTDGVVLDDSQLGTQAALMGSYEQLT